MGEAWRGFLPAYLLNFDDVVQGVDTSEHHRKVLLTSHPDSPDLLTFQPFGKQFERDMEKGELEHNLSLDVTAGAGTDDSPVTLTINLTMGDLTGALLRVMLDNRVQALAAGGRFDVSVDAPAMAGAFIYAVPGGGNLAAAQPLSGEPPFGYLSQGASGTYKGFGHDAGPSGYTELILIPFHAMGSTYENKPASVSISIAYRATANQAWRGRAQVVEHLFAEDICNQMPPGAGCCSHSAPHPCMTEAGGGGGGGGDGDCPPCRQVPDWCYGCNGQDQSAKLYAGLARSGINPEFDLWFTLDGQGTLVEISDSGGPFSYLVQGRTPAQQQLDQAGQWTVRWPDLPDQDANTGYLTLSGLLGSNQGEGTWVLGHPRLGDVVRGTWSAVPE
ncbi:MAG: hypothetical protein ACUVX9_00620 [Anaerolineae bacterium]